MGILDIIYNMVNKSGSKKQSKNSKKKSNTKSRTKTKEKKEDSERKIEEKIVIKDISDTNELLKVWDKGVKNVSEHPLSQVKIINTQIMEQLTSILTSMNGKLDKLSQLDEILHLLKDSRQEIRIVGGSTEKLDRAIAKIENLTVKDEEGLGVLNDKGPQTADNLARNIGVSRSTASSRLNRLNRMNILRKKSDGKEIHYSLHSQNND